MEKHNHWRVPYFPLLFALLILTGIFIGSRISPRNNGKGLFSGKGQYDKVNDLVKYIQESYVDTVNSQQLYDAAVDGLLQSLDPHSSYIPAADFHDVTDPLKGNFEGIGIQFRLVKDSIVVVNTIAHGPSAKAGLKAGDRIVTVDGKTIVTKKLSDNDVVKQLKGPKGSKVIVGVFRRGFLKLLSFNITRDVIPTYSLDASYMIEPGTGYLKLSKFSATTTKEFSEALMQLKKQGMQSLIIDLRDNSGGYLDAAINLAQEFLPKNAMIVYTEGRKRPKQSYYSNGEGRFQAGKVAILIDEGSASASEILAGAIQDNDRGIIIGRRSFGKGLVQEELDFNDGSAVRLTVARYYTPTGRCIQKPFQKNHEDYSLEPMKRFADGEVENPDSIHFPDSLKFTTPKGKKVYGGGGIMPDIYIPIDKKDPLNLFNKLANNGILYQYAFEYTDRYRVSLASFKSYLDFDKKFVFPEASLKDLLTYAAKNGVTIESNQVAASKEEIQLYCKALIARNLYDDMGFYTIYNRTDKTIIKAIEALK